MAGHDRQNGLTIFVSLTLAFFPVTSQTHVSVSIYKQVRFSKTSSRYLPRDHISHFHWLLGLDTSVCSFCQTVLIARVGERIEIYSKSKGNASEI